VRGKKARRGGEKGRGYLAAGLIIREGPRSLHCRPSFPSSQPSPLAPLNTGPKTETRSQDWRARGRGT